MSNIEIIKGVPIPDRIRSGGRKAIYPWEKLEVGDHFVFPRKVKKTTASSLTYRASKVTGRKFVLRTMKEGIKCWREE